MSLISRSLPVHVMEQLRNVVYRRPKAPHPWDPLRAGHPNYEEQVRADTPLQTGQNTPTGHSASRASVKSVAGHEDPQKENIAPGKPDSQDLSAWQAKLTKDNLQNRGHPNIVKMLDFFEDREFYYCK